MQQEIYRQALCINQTDSPSYSQLEVLTIDMSYDPTLSELKQAIRTMNNFVTEEVVLPRPYSEHDCTGAHFTTNIERIKRELVMGYDKEGINEVYKLIYILTHNIGVDV